MPDTIEERLRRLRAQQGGPAIAPRDARSMSIEERLAALRSQQQQPTQPQESTYEWFRRQLGLGGRIIGQKVSDVVASGAEILGSLNMGYTRPLRETAEIAGRSALSTVGSITAGTPTDPKIAEAERRRAERREASGSIYFQGAPVERARLAAEEAKDPSLAARAVRFLPQLLPYAGAAVATGGSLPAMAATGAIMELDQPANIPVAATLGAVPIPVAQAVKVASGAVRRLLGRGAEQIAEAEARAAVRPTIGQLPSLGTARPISSQISATGAASEAASIRARAASPSANLDLAVSEGAQELPRSLAQRAGAEVAAIYNVPRALVASGDFSAPLRQGALLTLPPSQWGRAAAAGVKMFEGFSTKRYNKIVEEIARHPDSQVAQRAGLHLSTQAKQGLKKSEEDFVSKYAARIPLVKNSQQSYEVYLDHLRLSTFAKYRALIDKRNISAEAKQNAYRESARWLNIASGRGTFGETIDKGMDALNLALFAPRFMASRINVLDPRTYARNLSTEGGRVVLRQQMSELLQAAGVLASTAALAKAAGASVSLDPNSSDFLKIKFGNRRLDLLAGEQQVMRLIYRTGAAIIRSARGEKSKPGEGALDVAGRFLRSKLAPIPSFFTDFLTRKTYTGKDFDAAKGVAQRVAPLIWQDFLDAYQKEGFGGVAATTPGLFGAGVQLYDQPGGFLDIAQPLTSEYVRFGRQIPGIDRLKDEGEEQFRQRVQVFGEGLAKFGVDLVNSEQYRQADNATKQKALELLPRRISTALLRQGESWALAPRILVADAKESIQSQQQREPRRLYDAQGRRLQ